jgi:hypothetical protein
MRETLALVIESGPRWSSQPLLMIFLALAVVALLLANIKRALWLGILGMVIVGLLFWGFMDWTVHYESYLAGAFVMEPRFRLTVIEQFLLSAIGGACAAVFFFVAFLLLTVLDGCWESSRP